MILLDIEEIRVPMLETALVTIIPIRIRGDAVAFVTIPVFISN
jgi:hypothetical protein